MVNKTTVTQYDVDERCRLYTADGKNVLPKVLGTGIAYPQRRSDGMLLPKKDLKFPNWFYKYPRADSFDLYRNSVGDTILRNLVPKSKLE